MSAPSPALQSPLNEAAAKTMRIASIFVALPSSVASALAYWVLGATEYQFAYELQTGVLIAAIGWTCAILSYWISAKILAKILIFSVQAMALYMVVSYGSIRAAESVLFLATVAAAGVFLSRKALMVSLLTSVVSLGAVAYAEITGLLKPDLYQVNLATWFTHAGVLTTVALILLYARKVKRKAYKERVQVFEENQRLAAERDHSLEHFSRIFRTSPSPMIAQSAATGKIVDANPAFERCYGYRKVDVLGHSDARLWASKEQRDQHRIDLRATKRAEQPDVKGLRADGSTFHGHIRSEWGSDNEGSLVITTITDMTEHNAIVHRLRRSEERFAKAFNLSPLNLIITRQSDDTVVEISHTEPFPGVEPTTDLRGLPASQVGPWFTPAGRVRFFDQLNAHGHLRGFETPLSRPDGTTIDAKVWAEKIELDEGACVLSCVVDTTEEKRRETMLRDIAKGMTGHTAQAVFDALTERMSHALGADMVLIGELSGLQTVQSLSVSMRGLSAPNVSFSIADQVYERSLFQSDPVVIESGLMGEKSWVNSDGAVRYEGLICQALHDVDGEPIGLLKALWIHPIEPNADSVALMSIFAGRAKVELMRLRTERKIEQLNETLEQRVQERTAELSKLNAELDSFAYSISHDLKSPLRAIDGFTQLLSERLEGRLDEEEQQLMGRVLGATHRMATLMADLLALARVNQMPLQRERVNLSELAEEVFRQQMRKATQSKVNWKVEPGVFGNGDHDLTRSVLEQLIENAIKYTRDQTHPLIEFGEKRKGSGETFAPPQFFLRDNGTGFSMEHADKLFKPFQRLHMPDSGFEGTGIGLATVRRIVERHGGFISGDAQVNLGAEFCFTLGDGKAQIVHQGQPSKPLSKVL